MKWVRWVALLLSGLLVASACTPADLPPETIDLNASKLELVELLEDPEFVESLGENEEEREAIIAEIRAFVEEQSDLGIDAQALRELALGKVEYDEALAAEKAEKLAEEERRTAEEKERLADLTAGPTFEEVVDSQTDGSENYDYSQTAENWKNVEGATQAFAQNREKIAAVNADVDAVIRRMTESGELAEADKIPGYLPVEAKDYELFGLIWEERRSLRKPYPSNPTPATGYCANRVGNHKAPTEDGLRPGTIFTPHQNTFAKTGGFPAYSGHLKTTMIEGEKHLVVEGHLADLDDLPPAPFGYNNNIWLEARARVNIHVPDNIATDHEGFGPYSKWWATTDPIESGTVQVLCYSDEIHPAPGEQIRRAMYRAYIPWTDELEGMSLDDPGFQVRVTVTDYDLNPLWFFGSDIRTVYLGDKPLHHNAVKENGGFGVSIGKGVIIDDNGVTGDDLESSLRAPVSSALTTALTSLEGSNSWVLGSGSYGWLGYHVNNSAPTVPNVDIEWSQTTAGGSNDDEFRLKGTISMTDWLLEGIISLPGTIGYGLIPCYFKFKVDWTASIYAAVDINDSAPTLLHPVIELADIAVDKHSMFTSPIPLLCNALYLFGWDNMINDKIDEKLPEINEQLSTQVSVEPAIDNAVPATVNLPNGGSIHADFLGFNDTCVPYQCNGHGAGDMAMSWAGLEASGDIRFTDSKAPSEVRRFPFSLNPDTLDTANGRIRNHFGPQNEITDFGAWINPAVLNQALRSVTEEGILDLDLNPQTLGMAQSPPIYLSEPVADDKPLGFWLPHLELDTTADNNMFAVDFFLGVGVGFDSGTRKLVPADIDPNDPGFGVQIWTLSCDSVTWAQCNGIPSVVSDVANWGANTLLDPLLEASIGEVTIPNTGGFSLSSFSVLNEDGHLGFRASVGAPQFRLWAFGDTSTYGFDSYFEGFAGAGTGPVTYDWTIKDSVSGAVIHTYSGPDHQLSGFDTTTLTPLVIANNWTFKGADATVTATRGTTTMTATEDIVFEL